MPLHSSRLWGIEGKRHLRLPARHGGATVGFGAQDVGSPTPCIRQAAPPQLQDYANDIRKLVDIFNDAWSGHWGFVPLTEAETDEMAKRMRMLLDDRLVWFAEVDGEAVAFIVTLPNINEAIRDLNGRLLPFGWAKLLWRLKSHRVRSARVPLWACGAACRGP